MRRFAVLLTAMLLMTWGSITAGMDMNRQEIHRLWKCKGQYQEERERAARGKIQPGQAEENYQFFPGDWRRACELVPPTGG